VPPVVVGSSEQLTVLPVLFRRTVNCSGEGASAPELHERIGHHRLGDPVVELGGGGFDCLAAA
jgi:hypothetical protein